MVLKASGASLNHKTELNGVALNIQNSDTLQSEAARLLQIGDALMVEEMVADGIAELILGIGFIIVFSAVNVL